MNKLILVLLFITLKSWASPRVPLFFKVTSAITADVLDYKITNVSFSPDSIFLLYDQDLERFISTDLSLNIETNIPKGEGADSFSYSLSMVQNDSVCINGNDDIVDSLPPSVVMNETQLELNTPITSLVFDDEVDGFLADKSNVTLNFQELDKAISSCSGDISVEVGVDI